MTDDILSLVRPDLKGFGGYSSAAKEAHGAPPSIKLDANESPWPPFGAMSALCATQCYAEPQPVALKGRMAAYWGVEPDEILTSAGSDQSIDALIRLFCRPQIDEILVCPPTFAMYQVYAQIQGCQTIFVPLLANGQLDVPAIEKAATPNTKLIFIPSPSAPMAQGINKNDILKICESRKGKSIVVSDEAYVEFSDEPQGCVPFVNKVSNIVVLRTLSKAHALAGERVGCTIAPKEVVAALISILPPYPLAASAVRAALDALSPAGLALSAARRKIIIAERKRMERELPKAQGVVRVWPSQTNFLFVETDDAAAFMNKLRAFDIQARSVDGQKKGAARLTIGSPEQNDMVLRALGVDIAGCHNPRAFAVQRQTKETSIDVMLDLDTPRVPDVETGIGFLDHMIAQIATHGGLGLTLYAKGDLQVDTHHTIEDCALVLGEAVRGALGDKVGVGRFGFTAPLDEALASVVLDLSGRPYFEIDGAWPANPADGMSPDLAEHFFRSFASTLGATIHLSVKGANNHHMIEASFKALGRALRQAVAREGEGLPSSKGVL